MKSTLAAASAFVVLTAAGSFAQPPPPSNAPRNDLPQPYRTTRDWGQLPPGTAKWAAVTAVEAAPDGSIYVIHRCAANSCVGRPEPPILKFDKNGKLLKAFGAGVFDFPHGACVDRDGNLWVTDATRPGGSKGHTVFKFSPDGTLLMTLGRPGVSGSGPELFDQPTDVVVAPNGDIFVTDSHRNGKNNRVVKFDRNGKFIKEWGRKGSGPGEFSEPHTIAMDSRGRLFVGDRENNRIQIFDPNGKFLRQFTHLGATQNLFITPKDEMWIITHRNNIENITYDTLAGRIMRIDIATGRILGAMESPGHWLNVTAKGEIFIGSLTGNVFRWYPGWLDKGLGSEEGLRPANQR